MENKTALMSVNQVGDVLQELEDAFFDIPFENSNFQNEAFVVAAQQTPARAYRAIGLRMHSKIRAVKEYQFQQELNQVDIDEKEAKIADPDTSEFDRRRLRIEIMKIQDGKAWGEKLLNDALRELDCLYAWFKKLPRYTREQFEREEFAHFELKLTTQLKAPGAHESLLNMHQHLPNFDKVIQLASAEMLKLQDKA